MTALSLCRILIRCNHCEKDMKVNMQQIADEEIVFCTCGKENQLIDFGRAVKQMIEEEIEMMEEEMVIE